MTSDLIEKIATNPWVVVGSYIVGILGIVIVFVVYFVSKEKFAMTYQVCELTLLSPEKRSFDMDLPILIEGQKLVQFTRSYVLIRNVGNKIIEPKDIVGSAAIKTINNASIIGAEIVGMDDPGSQVQIVAAGQTDNMRELSFEFLRAAEAFVVKIDHTGSTNELFVECNTKAGGAIRTPRDDAPMEPFKFVAMLALLGLIGPAIALIVEFFTEAPVAERFDLIKAYALALGVLFFVVSLIGPGLNYLIKRFLVGAYRRRPTDDIWRKIEVDSVRF